jgi:DNA-binding Xre family transcriptional regulator
MRALKIHYFLFIAVFMLAAKPFVGFNALEKLQKRKLPGIYVKAFTKRKQEYVEDSDFDVLTIQKRLSKPRLALLVLISYLLNTLFPSIFRKVKQVTASVLLGICLNLFPPLHRYLLSGKLVI